MCSLDLSSSFHTTSLSRAVAICKCCSESEPGMSKFLESGYYYVILKAKGSVLLGPPVCFAMIIKEAWSPLLFIFSCSSVWEGWHNFSLSMFWLTSRCQCHMYFVRSRHLQISGWGTFLVCQRYTPIKISKWQACHNPCVPLWCLSRALTTGL